MKRHLLLVMLLLFSMALLSTNNIYATTSNQQNSEITANISFVNESTVVVQQDVQNTTNIQNTTAGNLNEVQAVNNTVQNQQATYSEEGSDTNNESLINSSNSSVNIQNATEAAGDEIYNNVHGIWLSVDDVKNVSADELKKSGITDVFVKANRLSTPLYPSILTSVLKMFNGTGIRVHAWITCFIDENGKWVDPQGAYNYTVTVNKQVPVVTSYKSWYKVYTKKWYKSKGKWRYYWVYTWKYMLKSTTTYKTVTTTETRTGYSTTFNDGIINTIADITRNYNIDGIHLDYVRYPGTAYKYAGGTEAITSFVGKVYTTVKSIKPKVAISAALMPEGAVNGYYYGQDYSKLSQYLDFLVPMIYKGNYKQDTAWIGSTSAWISQHSNGKPVVAGLQTYRSDSDLTVIPASEIRADINSAVSNGASGYALFRYGWLDKDFFKNQTPVIDTTVKYTLDEIKDAASRVKTFVEANQKLPNYVQMGTKQVTMPEFLRLLTTGLLQVNNGSTASIALKSALDPSNPSGDLNSGNIYKSEYIVIAGDIKSYMDSSGKAPNYATSSLGKIQYESLVYMYSRIMNFYSTNKVLPSYVAVKPWQKTDTSNPTIPAELQKYLQPTDNCQSTDSRIKNLAASITQGTSSAYDQGTKLFNWVRDNIGYSFYYDTKYGAINTLANKTGNCVDTSHLLVALSRAAGIPARYVHGVCTFNSGNVYGHVWAQLYVNGKWYDADAISSANKFGVINNWNTNTWTLKGIYSELPF